MTMYDVKNEKFYENCYVYGNCKTCMGSAKDPKSRKRQCRDCADGKQILCKTCHKLYGDCRCYDL